MIYVWPANLTSAASVQANKQNNGDVRTSLRGRARTANTDIKRNEEKKTLGENRSKALMGKQLWDE